MLDTDVTSYLIKGSHPLLERRLAQIPVTQVCISAVTRGELRHGAARLPRATRLAAEVERFVSGITVLPWDAAAADSYGPIRAELERKGQPIGNLDTLIAAHAVAANVTLVTNNRREFQRVSGLRLANWSETGGD